ncbi:hypothetical protein BC831DRAFT_541824 [Entophlyctis helioformis]|nr:hypothetical protein BC831DRAFT_541824 [Entophlyctis helioformis]
MAQEMRSPFGLTVDDLSNLCDFDRRSEPSLIDDLHNKYGGVAGVAKNLRSDLMSGIPLKSKYHELHKPGGGGSGKHGPGAGGAGGAGGSSGGSSASADMSVFDETPRRIIFGENIIPPPRSETILEIIYGTVVEDPILKVLIVGAVVVLSLGTAVCPSTGWTEGLAIVLAVFIVLTVTAGNDWSKDRKFKKLLLLQTDKRCRVIRGGVKTELSSWDILVGDIVELVVGDEVPADGIFVSGNRLVVDESPLTGESMPCKKDSDSPFLFSGCQVSEGTGLMIVTAVGTRSSGGKIQEVLNEAQSEETPLQAKLKVVAIFIGKIGVAAGMVTFIGLAIRWAVQLVNNETIVVASCSAGGVNSATIVRVVALAEHFVVAITIIVVAVPEGLPLAVTLALSLSMFKMMRDKCFVRHLDASETMGQATTVCTDKTGTLTYNRMSVVRILVGDHIYKGEGSGDKDSIPFSPKTFNGPLKAIICEGVSVNSNCFIKNEDQLDDPTTLPAFVGSATEGALLMLARKLGVSYRQVRDRTRIAENGRMSTLIRVPDVNRHRLYTKGASEIVLGLCTHILDTNTMAAAPIKPHDTTLLQKTIKTWASEGLRTFALAYRDVENPEEVQAEEDPEHDLVFIALVAIKDPIRKEIPMAVSSCQRAGLIIRMVTGDNILTATKIAKECNIFFGDGIALEGPAFRAMDREQRIEIIPRLQVLARCSPTDKYELVSLLRELGEVVAVTGDGTNDAPALKEADVGFSMGISGTQIALNASDIVLLDDNFVSIVQAIRWGRNVLNTIRKFLQFQLGINLAAIIVTFVGAVFTGHSPLSTVQLLWVNLIMDSFGALALASDEPDEDILERPPQSRKDSILMPLMLEYIGIQTVYQVIVMLVVLFQIDTLVPPDTAFHPPEDLAEVPSLRARSMLFTTFILMQITNIISARQLNGELNLFLGFFRNRTFLAMIFVIVAIQVLAVTVGYTLFGSTHLDLREWLVAIVIALINLPIVFVCRLLSKIYHAAQDRQAHGRVEAEKLAGKTAHAAGTAPHSSRAHGRIDKSSEDVVSIRNAGGNYERVRGDSTTGNDDNGGQPLNRAPSLVEMVRGKIRVDAPLPTKSKSNASLNSAGSRGSRSSRK